MFRSRSREKAGAQTSPQSTQTRTVAVIDAIPAPVVFAARSMTTLGGGPWDRTDKDVPYARIMWPPTAASDLMLHVAGVPKSEERNATKSIAVDFKSSKIQRFPIYICKPFPIFKIPASFVAIPSTGCWP